MVADTTTGTGQGMALGYYGLLALLLVDADLAESLWCLLSSTCCVQPSDGASEMHGVPGAAELSNVGSMRTGPLLPLYCS